jgi:hypothetical protein
MIIYGPSRMIATLGMIIECCVAIRCRLTGGRNEESDFNNKSRNDSSFR